MSIGNLYSFHVNIDFQPSIGERIRKSRKNKKVSQANLAAAVGISQPSLSDIENGVISPKRTTLRLIAYELNDDFGEADLKQDVETRSQSPNAKLVEQVSEAIRDNDYVVFYFVWRLAKTNRTFRNLLDENKYRALLKWIKNFEILLEAPEASGQPTDKEFGQALEAIGFFDSPEDGDEVKLEPADLILARHIELSDEKDVSGKKRKVN